MKLSSFLKLVCMLLLCSPALAKAQKSAAPNFLFISDVHLNPDAQTTVYGLDAGMDVWNAFKAKLNAVMSAPNAPNFVVYTGDLPVHNGWCNVLTGTGAQVHDTANAMVLNELRNLSVKYKKPVFYMPGNNDAPSGDYLNFTDSSGQSVLSLIKPSPMFFPLCGKNNNGTAAPSLINENARYCYYSAKVMPGLRLIALNTVIFNVGCPANGNPVACAQEMVWLRGQLSDAKRAGDKVYIAMHVPPGNMFGGGTMWNTNGGVWIDTFLQMTEKYSTSIAGVFYGHTHMDELRRLWGPSGDTVTNVAICCPGISAQHTNNPGFKVISYDPISKAPTDFTTYYTPLPLTGSWPDSSYTFRGTFKYQSGSIYQCLKTVNSNTIATNVANIYEVKSGQGGVNAGSVIGFIEVKPQ